MENSLISKELAQKKLVILWLCLGLLSSILFMLVCWGRTENNDLSDPLQWFFNYISPGMTLIIGSFAYSAIQPGDTAPKFINRSYLNITMGYTVVYLLTIIIITVLCPLAMKGELMIDYFKKFNILLSFLQTSLIVLLGIFFSKENK